MVDMQVLVAALLLRRKSRSRHALGHQAKGVDPIGFVAPGDNQNHLLRTWYVAPGSRDEEQ